MHWVFGFDAKNLIFANKTIVSFQHSTLGSWHHHWRILGLVPYNLSLSPIKPNKTGFCWTSNDWGVFLKKKTMKNLAVKNCVVLTLTNDGVDCRMLEGNYGFIQRNRVFCIKTKNPMHRSAGKKLGFSHPWNGYMGGGTHPYYLVSGGEEKEKEVGHLSLAITASAFTWTPATEAEAETETFAAIAMDAFALMGATVPSAASVNWKSSSRSSRSNVASAVAPVRVVSSSSSDRHSEEKAGGGVAHENKEQQSDRPAQPRPVRLFGFLACLIFFFSFPISSPVFWFCSFRIFRIWDWIWKWMEFLAWSLL